MAIQNKILIIGATGYLGKYMVKASISMGHPTYVYVRPTINNNNPSRLELLQEFESMGVKVFQGNLDEHEKLVSTFRQVDIVISTLGIPQHKDQFKILDAMKEAGTIKRFVPSEFGCETDRVSALPPFQAIIDIRKEVRRATEASGIPYTFITANCCAAYFVDFLLHPHEERDEVLIYGTGEAKVVMTFEEDVAAYTIMVVNDPRTHNRIVNYRPSKNVVSQLDLISLWEKKSGKTLKRNYMSEEEAVALSQSKNSGKTLISFTMLSLSHKQVTPESEFEVKLLMGKLPFLRISSALKSYDLQVVSHSLSEVPIQTTPASNL